MWSSEKVHEWIKQSAKGSSQDVVWFPKNNLVTPDKPFLLPHETFTFETIPLEESVRRIYRQDFDFDKYLSQQQDGISLSIVCSFFLGTLMGGSAAFHAAKEEVNEKTKTLRSRKLTGKERAQIYNEGAKLIRNRVTLTGIMTGARFAAMTGAFGLVYYHMLDQRRTIDPLNFAAGGIASGAIVGTIQGGIRGLLVGGLGMGGVGLVIGCAISALQYTAKFAADMSDAQRAELSQENKEEK